MISRQAWDFHARVAEQFGPVFKYHGPFGVRPSATQLILLLTTRADERSLRIRPEGIERHHSQELSYLRGT